MRYRRHLAVGVFAVATGAVLALGFGVARAFFGSTAHNEATIEAQKL